MYLYRLSNCYYYIPVCVFTMEYSENGTDTINCCIVSTLLYCYGTTFTWSPPPLSLLFSRSCTRPFFVDIYVCTCVRTTGVCSPPPLSPLLSFIYAAVIRAAWKFPLSRPRTFFPRFFKLGHAPSSASTNQSAAFKIAREKSHARCVFLRSLW